MAGVPNLENINGKAKWHHEGLDGQRIAIFTGAYNHIADGVSLTLNRLVAHLYRLGADVRIFAPTIENPPVDHVGTLVPVRSFRFPGYPDYHVTTGLPRVARAELEAFAPTLIHVATPDVAGFIALRYAKKHGIPLVSSYHTHFASYLDYYWVPFSAGMLWSYLRWYYTQCDHIYVPSESMTAVLRAQGITDNLKLWQRGVDMERFNPARRSMAWRQSLGINDDEVIITFVSRLVWEKGLDVHAEVIEGLKARRIPHRSMIVGDGPARADLAKRLPETIFTGHLVGEALTQAYASSDVFLFPSATETFGNVTLEAMASGLPSVCADATGSRSLVAHGETGFLAPSGDTARFLEGVERLATDHTLRHTMGQKALERAHAYEWGAVLDRIVGYYGELLHLEHALAGNGVSNGHTVSAEIATPETASPDLGVSHPLLTPRSSV